MTSAAQQLALEKPQVRTVYFAEFQFRSGTQRLSSWNAQLAWGGRQTGTAQAGAASSLTLANAASAVDSEYTGMMLKLTDGSERSRKISGYVGSTRVATVDGPWQINALTKANAIDHANWTKQNGIVITADYAYGPDGLLKAERVQTPGGGLLARYLQTFTGYAGLNACFSVKMKSNTGANQTITIYLRETGFGATYGTASVTVTPEWQRFYVSGAIAGGSAGVYALVYDSSGVATWDISVCDHQVHGGLVPLDFVDTDTVAYGIPSTPTYEVQYDWTGLGALAGVGNVEESDSLDAKSLQFTLNPAQPDWLALAVGDVDEYRGLPAKLYFCPLDESYMLIGTPELCWRGTMDTVTIGLDGEEGNIILKCENAAYGLRQRKPLRLNSAQHKVDNPSDTGLDYLTDLIAHPQLWLTKTFQKSQA